MTSNFAVSTVATAPSPATSGTSVTVATGHGARFSLGLAVICPAGAEPTPPTAEVVEVTAIVGDVLTIVRARESSTVRTVIVGDNIRQGITAGMWDARVPAFIPRPMYGGGLWWPTVVTAGGSTSSFPTNFEVTWPAIYSNDFTIDQVAIQVTTAVAAASFRVGIYDSSGTGGLPGNLITEFTSTTQFDASTTGIKAVTGSYSFVAGTLYWWQLHVNGTATIRTYTSVPRPALRTSGGATDALAPISRLCFERNRGSFGALSSTWSSAAFAATEQHPAVAVRVV